MGSLTLESWRMETSAMVCQIYRIHVAEIFRWIKFFAKPGENAWLQYYGKLNLFNSFPLQWILLSTMVVSMVI